MSKQNYLALMAIGLIALLLLTACSIPDHGIQARRFAQNYYDFIKARQFARAAAMYPPKMRVEWQNKLQDTAKKLGNLQSYQINKLEESTVYSGKFYIFMVNTRYEKTTAGEILTLREKVNDNKLYILHEKISPDK